MSKGQTLNEFRIERSFKLRLSFFLALILLSATAILIQLFNLQVIQGEKNQIIAEDFVSKNEVIIAPRGQVFDRNFVTPEISKPLIYNHANLDIYLETSLLEYDFNKVKNFIKDFSNIMGISKSYYENQTAFSDRNIKLKLREKKNILLLTNITRKYQERVSMFESIHQYVTFVPSLFRVYSLGPAMAHISGYTGKPTQEDIESKNIKPYQTIGKNGIEFFYNSDLQGKDGLKIKKQKGKTQKIIRNSYPGNNLILTIDKKIQSFAYTSLQRNNVNGNIIVIKPHTGEILALVSNPSYNPNILSNRNRKERLKHFLEVKKNKGFLNLAIQSKFPPASPFKLLLSLVALENGNKINFNQNKQVRCKGHFLLKSTIEGVKPQDYMCWFKKGHGELSLLESIAHSCNVYFYELGYSLGSQPILMYSNLFGLNEKTNIDLPGEVAGFVPSSAWKLKKYGNKWFDGDTINLSIGQGYISTTSIAMTLFFISLLNDGKIYKPHVLKEIRNPITNEIIKSHNPVLLKDIPVKGENLETIKNGLRMGTLVGTSSSVFADLKYPEVAGKTGTAQTVRRGESSTNHAWFMGYAPFNGKIENQVVVSIFIQYGVGGLKAAYIARELFKIIFPKQSESLIK